jgi:hypothetical protein
VTMSNHSANGWSLITAKANDELKSIAQQKGVKWSSKEPTEKWISDKAYMNMMVRWSRNT